MFVGFDFSALEATLSAAFDVGEFCRREGLPMDPFAREIGKMVFLGKSEDGTDIHSQVAKKVGVPRKTAKTYGFATLYGSGLAGLEAVARPELPDLTPQELTAKSSAFLDYFKGQRIRGTNYWQGGLFSHFYNYAYNIISSSVPTLPLLGTQITTALRPEAVGSSYNTGRMNWVVQGSAGEMHDVALVLTQRKAKALGFGPRDFRFYLSIHDDLRWLVRTELTRPFAAVIKEAHAEAWTMLFQSLGFDEAPEVVKQNVLVDIDHCCRKDPAVLLQEHIDFRDLPPEAFIPEGLSL
jgi:DNA polymerase gamma 1